MDTSARVVFVDHWAVLLLLYREKRRSRLFQQDNSGFCLYQSLKIKKNESRFLEKCSEGGFKTIK